MFLENLERWGRNDDVFDENLTAVSTLILDVAEFLKSNVPFRWETINNQLS